MPAGASLDPYRDHIRTGKRALLAELLKTEILAALHVEACDFDRDGYLALVALWRANTDEEITP